MLIVDVFVVYMAGSCRRILFRCAFGGSSSTSLTVPQSHPPLWLTMAFNWSTRLYCGSRLFIADVITRMLLLWKWMVIADVFVVYTAGSCRQILFRCAFGGSSSTSLTVPQSHPPLWLTMAFNWSTRLYCRSGLFIADVITHLLGSCRQSLFSDALVGAADLPLQYL